MPNGAIVVFIIGIIVLSSLSILENYPKEKAILKDKIEKECYQQSKTQSEFYYCRDKLYFNYTGKKTLW